MNGVMTVGVLLPQVDNLSVNFFNATSLLLSNPSLQEAPLGGAGPSVPLCCFEGPQSPPPPTPPVEQMPLQD